MNSLELENNAGKLKDIIYTVRGQQVMLDSDLAEMYVVETKILNRAVKRNIQRFPENFRFKLTEKEFNSLSREFLRFQNGTLENVKADEDNRGKHRKYLPYVFTEQGVSMLSVVLK